MREKFLCFIHSSYLCSRRQKMQSIMKKKIYIIIAFRTFLTTEASAQQQVSFGPLHKSGQSRARVMVAAWRYGLPGRKTYDLSGKTGEECIYTPADYQIRKKLSAKTDYWVMLR